MRTGLQLLFALGQEEPALINMESLRSRDNLGHFVYSFMKKPGA